MTNVLITGGTKGIGRATARRFAEAGWSVAVVARTGPDLEEMEQHWKSAYHTPLLPIEADLQRREEAAQAIATVQQHWKGVDVLINNVGRFVPARLADGPEVLPEFLDLNVLAAYYLCRGVVPNMQQRGAGRILTVGSVATLDHPAHMGAYTVSKYALLGLHRALRAELAESPIVCKMVVPGATYTDSWKGVDIDPRQILAADTIADALFRQATEPPDATADEWVIRPT